MTNEPMWLLLDENQPTTPPATDAHSVRLADSDRRIVGNKAGNSDGQSFFWRVPWRWFKAHALEILLGIALAWMVWAYVRMRRELAAAERELNEPQLRTLTDAKRIIQTWLDKQGHDRCWYYPDLFRELAMLFGLEKTVSKRLPPLAEFQEGCRRYQTEEYAQVERSQGGFTPRVAETQISEAKFDYELASDCKRCIASAPTQCAYHTALEAAKVWHGGTEVSEAKFTEPAQHITVRLGHSSRCKADECSANCPTLKTKFDGETWERYSKLYPQQAFELRVKCDAACRKPDGTLDVERANARISEEARLRLARRDKHAALYTEAEKRGTFDPC